MSPTVTGHFPLITPSLQEALPDLMHVSETGFLWIDQLCINQEDLIERSRQVAIMHDIYAGGFRTLIWLGQDNEHARLFRQILELIGCRFQHYRKLPSNADWHSGTPTRNADETDDHSTAVPRRLHHGVPGFRESHRFLAHSSLGQYLTDYHYLVA